MTRTCFILDELYPKDKGGIARLMHNVIHHAKSLDPAAEIHVVLACPRPKDDTLQAAFEGIASLHYFRPTPQIATRFGLKDLHLQAIFPRQADTALRELKVLDAVLHAAAQTGPFDHIEIPDHLGLGAGLLQAKRARFGFENTKITCRIHSSLSIIIEAEPFYHARNDWLAPRLELERFALAEADRVVAHLPCIAQYNQSHFSFAPAWLDKVELSFPPVIWPAPEATPDATKGGDFIFTSRFQPFKRPELFIKAAITLLDSVSDYAGNFRLISYGFTPEYIDYLRLLIPARHHDRILIQTNISAKDRLAAIAIGIIVQPSKYESLCALAYEASTAMRPLLVPEDCLAFAKDPHWQDQKNCLFFTPTPQGLAGAMEAARDWVPKQAVDTTPDTPYFLQPPAAAPTPNPTAQVALLSGPIDQPETASTLATHFGDQKVNTFGLGALSQEVPSVAYHRFSEGGIAAQQWHDLAHSLQGDAVILHSPDALPMPEFIAQGAQVVCLGTAYSSNSLDASTGRMVAYPGKFKTINLAEPRMCPPCIMLHRDDLFRLATKDDDNLMARLITRLANSDLTLAFSPAPNVLELNYTATPPQQRQLGFEGGQLWQNSFRWIGIATRPSQNAGLLKAQPIALTLKATPDKLCTAEQPVQVELSAPQVFALESSASMENAIFCLTVGDDGGQNLIEVSLQKAFGSTPKETALASHKNGHNVRKLLGGQKYSMRWGPIWHDEPLLLVITAQNPAKLQIANPILTSRS